MFNNLISTSNVYTIIFFIFDAVLILLALGLIFWYFIKTRKNKKASNDVEDFKSSDISQIDNDTYVVVKDETPLDPIPYSEIEESEVARMDNAVEHFANQISDIQESVNSEMGSSAVIINHEVEQHTNKVPVKDEIQNYVVVGGVKKKNTSENKDASFNRGSKAFQNSTQFINTIKEEQSKNKK